MNQNEYEEIKEQLKRKLSDQNRLREMSIREAEGYQEGIRTALSVLKSAYRRSCETAPDRSNSHEKPFKPSRRINYSLEREKLFS